ncbi:MAG TPA: penicillin-binding transpeptidase domain-containing protein, partial [Thermoguttaceae bacterium]|nr:penicillin-binding transpeptidase domain-containing protein [Thermoguttaceae bacterium]
SSRWIEAPRPGEVLALTLDARLQATAETLLDEALARRTLSGARPATAGAAAVVMDVRTGAILACASAPRFDPNVFDGGDNREVRRLLGDPARPLFDRTIQMAVAPGSLSKIVTAAALVESRAVDPRESFYCRGYLEKPTALRCQIYDQFERGHGEVTLPDALAESCNVYFFHHAGRLGPGPLTAWLDRFGFGRATGVDLPGEAAGCVPTPESIAALEGHDWKVDDTRRVAVGQGSLTVTPMQAVRMTAAVANGGRLVSPHVVQKSSDDDAPPDASPVPGLDAATLDAIRHGLEMAVASPKGTAHATVFNESIAVAGKTGTAQTGGDRSPHAWFAGYAPVDDPRVALVVVVEHAGDGGEVAGPVAARLLLRLAQLGLLDTKEMEPQINTDEHR